MALEDFEFTEKQCEAIELLKGTQRHTCTVGGARSGKTFVLVYATMLRAIEHANSRHGIFRLTANSVRHSITRDTLMAFHRLTCPNIPMKMHWQDGFCEFPNGSQIWMLGLDDKERVEKVLGMEFSTIYFNECSQIRYATVQLVRNRLAHTTSIRPGLVTGQTKSSACSATRTHVSHYRTPRTTSGCLSVFLFSCLFSCSAKPVKPARIDR
jgi:phage terminase large subunit